MLPGTGRQTESTSKRREYSRHTPGSSGSGRPRCGYIAQPHEAACSFSAKIGINSAQWYSIADLFPGPFALPAPESRREQDLHTEQAECKEANWGSKAPARPLLRALWRAESHQLYPSEGVPHIIRGIHTDAHFHGLDDELRVASAASEMQLRLLPCCGHRRVGDGETRQSCNLTNLTRIMKKTKKIPTLPRVIHLSRTATLSPRSVF